MSYVSALEFLAQDTLTRFSPRMVQELRDRGFGCSENTVAKLMKENGIVVKGDKSFKPPKQRELIKKPITLVKFSSLI